MRKLETAELAAAEWRRLGYMRRGYCQVCGFERDEDGRVLTVRRGDGGHRWTCLRCYQRAHVRQQLRRPMAGQQVLPL
jgi:hypothetical protein